MTIKRILLAGAAGVAMLAVSASGGLAGTGDMYKVSGERVNLRGGPSNQAAIRGQLLQGEELIELTQHGGWLGVRVARTGEEGWIFSDLVRRTSQSSLNRVPSAGGFQRYSRDFDVLVESIDRQLGMPMVAEISQGPSNTLRVTPTAEWMLGTSRDAKLYAALALWQMWKNTSRDRPANVAIVLGGANYISVNDTPNGPVLGIEPPNVGALTGSTR